MRGLTPAATACESSPRMRGAPAIAAIGIVSLLAAALAGLFRPRQLTVELGAFDHPFATGAWGRADRLDVDETAAAGGPASFYYRPAESTVRLALPFTAAP